MLDSMELYRLVNYERTGELAYYDSDGVPQVADDNVWPLDHDPYSLSALGRGIRQASSSHSSEKVSMPLARWFNQSEGVVVCEFISPLATNGCVVSLTDGTSANLIALVLEGGSLRLRVVKGGAEQASIEAGSIWPNTITKAVFAYGEDGFAVRVDETFTSLSAALPAVTQMWFGSINGASGFLNGYMRKVLYYAKRPKGIRELRLTEDGELRITESGEDRQLDTFSPDLSGF